MHRLSSHLSFLDALQMQITYLKERVEELRQQSAAQGQNMETHPFLIDNLQEEIVVLQTMMCHLVAQSYTRNSEVGTS